MNWTGAKMDRGVACRLAAALSFAVNESGAISTKTVVLLTPEEVDVAANKKVKFRAPGHWSGNPTRFPPLTFASRSAVALALARAWRADDRGRRARR
jgi:hypothetical protein